MALPISVTYTFATATSAIPLSQLDSNFTTVVNGINGIGNGTNALSNVSITGGAIDGATIGATTSSTGRFSTVTATTGNITTINATTTNSATVRADGNLTFQSNGTTTAMTIDTSQRVGIGTTSPAYKLDVNGGVNNTYMRVTGDSSDAFYGMDTVGIYCGTTSATKPIRFLTNSSEVMRIDSSGNVGIGSSSPSEKLSVYSAIGVRGSNFASTTYVGSSVNTTGVYTGLDAGGGFAINVRDSGYQTFSTANTERMRLDSSGNMLLGTTSSVARFTLSTPSLGNTSGNIQNAITSYTNTGNGDAFEVFYTRTASSSGWTNADLVIQRNVDGSNGQSQIRFGSGNYTSFWTNSAERARIDSSGNLMVGGTSALNGNARFSVWNSAGNSFGIATGYGTGTSQFRLIYITSANNNLNFDNGANNATLSSAGAWTNASDARIKNSIVDIKYGINDVMKLQPRSYKMNEVEGEYIGFVAQEIQNVIPEVVSGDPEKQLGVDYGSLAALLTKAIQEQQAQIEELKAKVAALGAK